MESAAAADINRSGEPGSRNAGSQAKSMGKQVEEIGGLENA